MSVSVELLSPALDPAEVKDPALVATHIWKTYGKGNLKVRALDDVSLAVSSGQLTAVMGPSGSGKSTLLNCLAGLDRVSAGSILLNDQEMTALSEKDLTLLRRDQIGFIFQAYNLIPTLTVAENIALPARIAGQKTPTAHVEALAEAVGLGKRLHRLPSELSGGEQQRVACARAFITSPAVVFADEPTGSLDSATGDQILALLRRSVDDLGQTVVMVTHDPRAAAWADRIIFLGDGRIVGELWNPDTQTVLAALGELSGETGDVQELPEAASSTEEEVSQSEDVVDVQVTVADPERDERELEDIAAPMPLSEQAAQIVDRATHILQSLEGPVIDRGEQVESTPQTDAERDRLYP